MVDMSMIEYNLRNNTKCCSLCGISETTKHLVHCEANQDAITEEIVENFDKDNSGGK